MRRSRILVAVLVGIALIGGPTTACAAGGGRSGPADAATVGLSGSLMQYRSDIANRILTVRVRADRDLRVERMVLRPAGFTPLAAVRSDTAVDAGGTADLRVGYGAARCDGRRPGPSTALLTVVHDRVTRDVVLILDDEYDAIAGLRRAECAEREVRAQADIGFGRDWVRDGDLLRGTLRLSRVGADDPVTVTELDGTTLFDLRGPPVTLGVRQAMASVPVEIETTRCDPHALAESKRATAFVAYAAAGDGELVRLTVNPAVADRELLLTFATDSCGVG